MNTIYDELYAIGRKHAKHEIWVFSDLQQKQFELAKKCLNICMTDYESMGKPAEMIWYLGDSTESDNLPELLQMTDLQENAFGQLGIPLCYATGNHDYDYAEFCHKQGLSSFQMPFYDMVRRHPGWYTTRNPEETCFSIELDNYAIFFFCDHIAKDLSWCSTHNGCRWGEESYPYEQRYFDDLRQRMLNCGKKNIITAAHCAFPGGNRETKILGKIQPLPLNVKLHLYGHSHIGEYTCPKERIFSQIQWVDWQDIPQVDVSSFENVRGSFCRSVFLQIYEDDSLGLFFRNHDERRFTQAFFPKMESSEILGNYEQREILSIPWWEKR